MSKASQPERSRQPSKRARSSDLFAPLRLNRLSAQFQYAAEDAKSPITSNDIYDCSHSSTSKLFCLGPMDRN